MKVIHFLAGLSFSVLLSACAAFNTAGDVAQGRQALLEGKYQLALDYFWAADQTDPHYMYGAELREGVLSYLGRAQYLTTTMRKRVRLWKKIFPIIGATMLRGYILALPSIG
jgi:hypothetical protein